MVYEKEYLGTDTIAAFIKLVVKKYPVKESTARRRYYDLRLALGEQKSKQKVKTEKRIKTKKKVIEKPITIKQQPQQKSIYKKIVREVPYPPELTTQPAHLKMMMIDDMKRFKYVITRERLRQYGFNDMEINYLVNYGEVYEQTS